MPRGLVDNLRPVQSFWSLSASKLEVRRSERSFADGRIGIGAFKSQSDEDERRDWQGEVIDVSMLIADDLRERTCEVVETDSSDDVEGAGEGGE